MNIFDEQPCVMCDKTPSDYILFDEDEPLLGFCEEHHAQTKNREKCDCVKRSDVT